MTVTEIIAQGKVRCSWFVGNKHSTAVFPPKSLQLPGEDPRDIIMREAAERIYGSPAEIEKPALNAPPSS